MYNMQSDYKTISGPSVIHLMDATMETATLAAILGAVAAMVVALVLFAVLPDIKPSNALRQVKYVSVLSP
jgi:hypothetical protein